MTLFNFILRYISLRIFRSILLYSAYISSNVTVFGALGQLPVQNREAITVHPE